jgi:hypothetical protein
VGVTGCAATLACLVESSIALGKDHVFQSGQLVHRRDVAPGASLDDMRRD